MELKAYLALVKQMIQVLEFHLYNIGAFIHKFLPLIVHELIPFGFLGIY
jgi:hypothetical protein